MSNNNRLEQLDSMEVIRETLNLWIEHDGNVSIVYTYNNIDKKRPRSIQEYRMNITREI